ncbi:MAG TPA: HAMP domain-containing sensor histidine kinase, partial [Vicinamibacteria bacterium]
WAGFAAATLAVLTLLLLQYRWLGELERSTALARRAILLKVLDVVSREAFSDLKASAEPVFGIAHSDLSDEGLSRLGTRLDFGRSEGVRRFFVYSLQARHPLHFLDPGRKALAIPDYSEETLAVWSAVAPWTVLAKKGAPADDHRVHSDERDPRHRILLRVIPGPGDRIVGVAGVVIDDSYFARQALPRAIRSTLSSFPKGDEFAVFVGNEWGESILPDAPPTPKQQWTVSRRLTPPFSDWTIAVQDRRSTPERLARQNFALNMTLSLVLGALLLGAILLTTRTAAREMRLSSMKSDFVSNVSHELRTPLASIRVFGELLRTGRVSSSEKVVEYGERIETEAMRLSLLVENILDFSRIESGRKAYRFEEKDLAEVVRAGVAACAARARGAGFRIELHGVEAGLPPIPLDASAIEQALCNVLENAVKYSGDGRDIGVTVARRGDEVVVSVRDQGIGIPRHEQERIFERFHRVGGSLVHEVRGVGLGLAIVRHIVEAHRGRVEVESEPGRGSTFRIVLPLGASEGGAPRPAVAGTPA